MEETRKAEQDGVNMDNQLTTEIVQEGVRDQGRVRGGLRIPVERSEVAEALPRTKPSATLRQP